MSTYEELIHSEGLSVESGAYAWDYRTHILPEANIMYFVNPKAGCTTTMFHLHMAELIRRDDPKGQHELLDYPPHVHDLSRSPLPPLSSLDPAMTDHVLTSEDVYRFTIVRHPADRVVSAYLDKIAPGQGYFYDWVRERASIGTGAKVTFVDFLKVVAKTPVPEMDIHWRPQSEILRPNLIHFHYIGRFEHFPRTLNPVLRRIPPEWRTATPAPHKKTGATERRAEFLSVEARDLIHAIYEKDFAAFAYTLS